MTKQQAKDWIDDKLPDLLAATFEDPERHWSGDVLRFRSRTSGVAVTLSVTDSDFRLSLSLPGLARLFEGKARAAIETWLDANLPG